MLMITACRRTQEGLSSFSPSGGRLVWGEDVGKGAQPMPSQSVSWRRCWRGNMTKPKRGKPSSRKRPAKPGARRMSVLTLSAVLAVGIIAAVVLLRGEKLGGMGSPQPSSAAPGAHPLATGVVANAGFQALQGRWLRPD